MERGGKLISEAKKMGQKDSGICYTKFRQAIDMVWGSECQVTNLQFFFWLGGIGLIRSILSVCQVTFIYCIVLLLNSSWVNLSCWRHLVFIHKFKWSTEIHVLFQFDASICIIWNYFIAATLGFLLDFRCSFT